jgi:ParB family chromosome partitioning protein
MELSMTNIISKKQSLGKGLSALLGPELRDMSGSNPSTSVVEVDIMIIAPSIYQPRRVFKEEELRELASSMFELGVLQPILLRRIHEQRYEIIAGERRYRAAKLAGLTTVPAIIKDYKDDQMFEVALIENMQRKDLSALEEAEGMAQYMEEFGYTQQHLSEKLGKSRSYIANTLRLIHLPLKVKLALLSGEISAGHGRALLSSEDPEQLMSQVLSKNLNVRDTENLAKKSKQKQVSKPKGVSLHKDVDLLEIEAHISIIFNTKATVEVLDNKGKISIHFTSLQMLDDLIHKMGKIQP